MEWFQLNKVGTATFIILIHYLYLVSLNALSHQLYQYVWGHLDLAIVCPLISAGLLRTSSKELGVCMS